LLKQKRRGGAPLFCCSGERVKKRKLPFNLSFIERDDASSLRKTIHLTNRKK